MGRANLVTVGRWTGTWLQGPGAGLATATQDWPGQRLGLPADGPGAAVSTGRRAVAFLLDALLSAAVAGLFTLPDPPQLWSYVPLTLAYVLLVPLTGQTPGMRVLGIRLVRAHLDRPVDLPRATLRYALLALLIPALITDADRRGLHDRAAGTAVVRS